MKLALTILVIISVCILNMTETVTAQSSSASGGTNVDSTTYIIYPEGSEAITAISNNTLDLHYQPILPELVDSINQDLNVQLIQTTGGAVMALDVNPASIDTKPFNPFSLQEVRYSLNYLIDRDKILHDYLGGSGSVILSAFAPTHPDYILVHKHLEALGIIYNATLADNMITTALLANDASKVDGKWHHTGNPIEIIVFIRHDDPIRSLIGELISSELESLGFTVERKYGDLSDAYDTVYGADPSDFGWHLHTAAWGGNNVIKYDRSTLAVYYAPWAGNMPGWSIPEYWNYENTLIDDLTEAIYYETFESSEQRAGLVRYAVDEAVKDSVRLFLVAQHDNYAVSSDVTNVVAVQGDGITSRYTPINAQTASGDLKIGVRHITQSSWNPVDGFGDVYAGVIWNAIHDPSIARDPLTGDLMPVRASWTVETAGPDGMLDIPDDAIIWDPITKKWETVPPTDQSISRVTFDLKLGNWHNGQSMDINDILYPLYFEIEYITPLDNSPIDIKFGSASATPNVIQAVNVLDDDTIEIYLNYWSKDSDIIASTALPWSSVPWEVYVAMENAVNDNKTSFSTDGALAYDISWLSLLNTTDSELLKEYLTDFTTEDYIPSQLWDPNKGLEYAQSRYNSTISWIEDKGHSVISHGPFYLDAYWPENGTLRTVAFNDPTYPFDTDHWNRFTDTNALTGEIQIGSIAPLTGGATSYGLDIQTASKIAVIDFNHYLEERGESWFLKSINLDSQTHPTIALQHLQTLNSQGIKIVNGPSIDIMNSDILDFTNEQNMALISCCSALPSLAIDGDSLFRMVPDHRNHASAIADLMYNTKDVKTIVPVGINAPWATELVAFTITEFESMGGKSASSMITYNSIDDFEATITTLVNTLQDQQDNTGYGDIAILYVGFEEGSEFLKTASEHDILGNVKWFGADQNTASPNILDDPIATKFAKSVMFTPVQISTPDNIITREISSTITSDLGRAPSPYASFEYDAIWLIGLSILENKSDDPSLLKNSLVDVASRYVGAIGSVQMTSSGDLADADYTAWMIEDAQWKEYVTAPPKRSCR